MVETRLRRSGAVIVWSLLCLSFVVAMLVVATESALHFTGTPIDGPFQLYNALRRIAAGYRAGVDFQFFHGLGLPYLYYGLFRAFGAGLRGSELARNLVSPIVYTLVLLAFFRAFLATWSRTLCATAIVLALAFTIRASALFFALVFAINGMLGVRSALPILLPVVLYRARTLRTRAIFGGLVLGLALLFGTEQGLAALFAFIAISALAIARRREKRLQMIEAIATVAIAAATLVLALTVIGGPAGMRGALRYNFSLVPADQYWFFGAPPNVFVQSWSAAPAMILGAWQIALAIGLGLIATLAYARRFWREPTGPIGRRNYALATLPAYGIISLASLLGVFTPVYAQPCWRTIALVGVIELFAASSRFSQRARMKDWLGAPRYATIVAYVLVVASYVTVPTLPSALGGSLPHVLRAHVFSTAPLEIDGIWPQTLRQGQAIIDARRDASGKPPTLWSTYSGWIEARNGLFNPSFDYMIHALGPENRRDYVGRFRETAPRLVQTVLPTFTQYEPWLENNDWAFYDELLNWYEVTAQTPWSFYWERRATQATAPISIGEMRVPAGMNVIPLPPVPAQDSSPITLLEVEVDYTIRNPLGWLPVVGKAPRYLVRIDGALSHLSVSLDPFVGTTRFPLVIRRGDHPTLIFHTASLLPGASFVPTALRFYERPIAGKNTTWLDDLARRLAQ